MKTSAPLFSVLIGALAAAMLASSCSTTVEAAKPPHRLHLPAVARELIWEHMQDHGTEMTMLLWSVLFLDRDSAAEQARALVAQPKLARPIGAADSTINARIPNELFELQDAFQLKAKHMVSLATAPEPDNAAIAVAFGELAASCVRCHSSFLEEPRQ